jgi:CBS domain-containing protein
MEVRKLMQRKLITVTPSSTLHEAAVKMKKEDIGSVLVVEDGMMLKGILTDRDIALAVAADDEDPNKTTIGKIMKTELITIGSSDDITAAIRVMCSGNVRRLPVCEKGKIVGLLSSADVASEIKEEINNFIGLEEAFAKH